MAGGRAHAPSPLVAGIGKGRFRGVGRRAVLEQRDGATWTPIGRFASVEAADVALDEAVGAGASPDSLRVSEVQRTLGVRAAMVGGVIVAVGLIAWLVYIQFLGPA